MWATVFVLSKGKGASIVGFCLLATLVLNITVFPWRIRERFRELDRAERAQAGD
jgi:hypothetical protein